MLPTLGTADLSPDGRFRYLLTRWWGEPEPDQSRQRSPLFVMLNPSTADADRDDATIRKCRGFAERWGFEGVKVVNLYAYRARDPKDLKAAAYPVGRRNSAVVTAELFTALRLNAPIICAWGAHARPEAVEDFRGMVSWANGEIDLHCLGTTKDGQPRHPLMLAYSTPLERWS